MSTDDSYLEYYSEDEDTVDHSNYTNDETGEQTKPKSVEPKRVLKLFNSRLTDYEKEEIMKYNKVSQRQLVHL